MKKKEIEKIPYMKPKRTKDKKIKFIVEATVQEAKGEKILLVEVYKRNNLRQPAVRVALGEQDFANYYPCDNKWDRKKIRSTRDKLLWEDTEYFSWNERKREILISKEHQNTIKDFTNRITGYYYGDDQFWRNINNAESTIISRENIRKREKTMKKKKKELNQRMKDTPKINERCFLEAADRQLFPQKNYIFYKKKGPHAMVACTKCGGATKARWKGTETYEQQFERRIEEPREGEFGYCPMCGERGEFKCQGRAKKPITIKKNVYLMQKFRGNGLVVRYFEVEKTWKQESIQIAPGNNMLYNAQEGMEGTEIARAYFEEGKKVQIDYHKHDPYTDVDFWDDRNLSGLYQIPINAGKVLLGSYEAMEESFMKYSAIELYDKNTLYDIRPTWYLRTWQQYPQLEMIVKMGMYGLAERLIREGGAIVADPTAKRIDKFLGINPGREKILKKHDQYLVEVLEVLQTERRMKANWTEDQIDDLTEMELTSERQLETPLKYMTLQKLINRIKKYATFDPNKEMKEQWRYCARSAMGRIAVLYTDYLRMKEEEGYDMSNSINLYPKDIKAAHDRVVLEKEKTRAEERKKEVEEKYPGIKLNYKKLLKLYGYKKGKMIIRPAESASEIVEEGRTLHHCVGGDNYLRRHDELESVILFMRSKDDPDIPYVTIEMVGGRIKQWFGMHDTKPNQEENQEFLNKYVEYVKQKLENRVLKNIA